MGVYLLDSKEGGKVYAGLKAAKSGSKHQFVMPLYEAVHDPVAENLIGLQCAGKESEPAIIEDKGDYVWRGCIRGVNPAHVILPSILRHWKCCEPPRVPLLPWRQWFQHPVRRNPWGETAISFWWRHFLNRRMPPETVRPISPSTRLASSFVCLSTAQTSSVFAIAVYLKGILYSQLLVYQQIVLHIFGI